MRDYFLFTFVRASAEDRLQKRKGRSDGFFRVFLCASLMFAFIASTLTMWAQEFVPENAIVPIAGFKPEIKHLSSKRPYARFSRPRFAGTGFCLDRECRFVGTNYHVAMSMSKYILVKGELSKDLYLDSCPDDVGAQDVQYAEGNNSLKFALTHDLAIYEMQHPLKDSRGVAFESDNLEHGSEVDIYSYQFDGNRDPRLVRWHGNFLGTDSAGLLVFDYAGDRIRLGASGGIVVDRSTRRIVGILNSIAEGTDQIAFAVPIKELTDFVERALPSLAANLFSRKYPASPAAPNRMEAK